MFCKKRTFLICNTDLSNTNGVFINSSTCFEISAHFYLVKETSRDIMGVVKQRDFDCHCCTDNACQKKMIEFVFLVKMQCAKKSRYDDHDLVTGKQRIIRL